MGHAIPIPIVGVGGRAGPIYDADQSILGVIGIGSRSIAGQVAIGIVTVRDVPRIPTAPVAAPVQADDLVGEGGTTELTDGSETTDSSVSAIISISASVVMVDLLLFYSIGLLFSIEQ